MSVVADIARMAERDFGVRVIWTPGCANRGNGSQWAHIEGIDNHHTGGGNNIFLDQNLVSGRSDLTGPLCNFAGLFDGDLAVVAEGPANHAGASGGWDTWPLTVTRDFNRRVLGIEMQYHGSSPMSPEQWRTLAVVNHCTLVVLGYPGEYVRVKNHNGTSVQGKWDMGYAPGKTIDINEVRRASQAVGVPRPAPAPAPPTPKDPEMSAAEIKQLRDDQGTMLRAMEKAVADAIPKIRDAVLDAPIIASVEAGQKPHTVTLRVLAAWLDKNHDRMLAAVNSGPGKVVDALAVHTVETDDPKTGEYVTANLNTVWGRAASALSAVRVLGEKLTGLPTPPVTPPVVEPEAPKAP